MIIIMNKITFDNVDVGTRPKNVTMAPFRRLAHQTDRAIFAFEIRRKIDFITL